MTWTKVGLTPEHSWFPEMYSIVSRPHVFAQASLAAWAFLVTTYPTASPLRQVLTQPSKLSPGIAEKPLCGVSPYTLSNLSCLDVLLCLPHLAAICLRAGPLSCIPVFPLSGLVHGMLPMLDDVCGVHARAMEGTGRELDTSVLWELALWRARPRMRKYTMRRPGMQTPGHACQPWEFLVCVDWRGASILRNLISLYLAPHIPPFHETIILLPVIPFYVVSTRTFVWQPVSHDVIL